MSDEQLFCLRWNNFQTNFTSQFEALRAEEDFVDVTLACEGKRIKAHKLVLSACSPYFKELFKGNPCKHPIIFMQDVEYEHLLSLVEFMYAGEVNIAQAQLPDFLHTAECLQIRGLTAAPQKKKSSDLDKTTDSSKTSHNENHSRSKSQCKASDENNGEERHPSKKICRLSDQPHHSRDNATFSNEVVETKTEPLFQPKTEPMEYFSDGESKPVSSSPQATFDSSADGHAGYSLQGSLDISSQLAHYGESSQENTQDLVGEMCKPHSLDPHPSGEACKPHSLDPRPCPVCGRIYSNISNLRQHIRLIHYPECITCPLCYKPFKNKLYLRRHLLSYHEWNSQNQNDPRFKQVHEHVLGLNPGPKAPETFYSKVKTLDIGM